MFLKGYFWDVKFEELDSEEDGFLVIKRILDRGDTQSVKWVLGAYGLGKVRELLTSSRDLSRQTAGLWAMLLNLPVNEVPCLNKPYSPIPFGLSS